MQIPIKKIKLCTASLNGVTMQGRASETVETLARMRINMFSPRNMLEKLITGKDSRYKIFCSVDISGFRRVDILVAEK